MVLALRHSMIGAVFLCMASLATPSNADGPVVYQWVAPDGTVFTVQVMEPRTAPRAVPPPTTPAATYQAKAPSPPQPWALPPAPDASSARFQQEVLALTNAQRAAGATCGGPWYGPAAPLVESASLDAAAQRHSADMGARDYFDHTSLDGRSVGDRVRATGFAGRTWGENIFAGPSTAAEVVDGWMKSPGHCVNIMNPRFRYLGIGYASSPGSRYTNYWTQDFGG